MRNHPLAAFILALATVPAFSGELAPGPKVGTVLASALEASPSLRRLAQAVRWAPGVSLVVELREQPPGLRAHARLDVAPQHLSGTIFIPPGRFEEQAVLLAHELTHVLDVLEGRPAQGGDAEARAVLSEHAVHEDFAVCRHRHRKPAAGQMLACAIGPEITSPEGTPPSGG
jgi:hypothetical protein